MSAFSDKIKAFDKQLTEKLGEIPEIDPDEGLGKKPEQVRQALSKIEKEVEIFLSPEGDASRMGTLTDGDIAAHDALLGRIKKEQEEVIRQEYEEELNMQFIGLGEDALPLVLAATVAYVVYEGGCSVWSAIGEGGREVLTEVKNAAVDAVVGVGAALIIMNQTSYR